MHAAGFELIPVGHKNYKTVYKNDSFWGVTTSPTLSCSLNSPYRDFGTTLTGRNIASKKNIHTGMYKFSANASESEKASKVQKNEGKQSRCETVATRTKRSTETMRQYWIKWAFKWQPIRASQIPQTLIRTEYAHRYLEMKCREEAYSLTSFQPQYEWKEIGCQQGVAPSIKTCQTFREMKKWSRRRQRRQRFTDGTIPLSVLSLSHTIQPWEFLSAEFIGVQ